jgi:peptide methionine sulfoxide reductase MsrA
MRFNRGNELSEQIETIKRQIDNVEYLFDRSYYPRTESSWKLSAIINDSYEDVNLSSEEFWECVETIIDAKHKKLEQLQQEFYKL